MKECSQLSCMYNTLKGCVVDEHFGICPLSNTRLPDVPVTDVGKTNADHIRSMTDEELADVLCVSCAFCACHPLDNCPPSCQAGVLEWLKQPYKEEV